MTLGITGNYGYNPYLYNQYQNQNPEQYSTKMFYNNAGVYTPTFAPTTNPGLIMPQQQPKAPDNTADGKDDGKIGFWGALKNIGKGIIKTITSPFTDEQGNFSLWKTIKSVAIGAAIAFIPGAAPIALAAGVVMGGAGVAKAAYNIATAKTDAEDEAAWQSLGGSATVLAASVYGAKQYGSAQAGESVSAWKGVKQVFSDSKATVTNAWNTLKAESPASLWNKGVQKYTNIKDSIAESYQNAKQLKADWKVMTNEQKQAFIESQKLKAELKLGLDNFRSDGSLANTSFGDMLSTVRTIARKGLKNGRTAVHNIDPAKAALIAGTFGVVGRTSYVPDFYAQLNPQEQAYYDALPEEQKQALIDQYYAVAA